MHQRSLVGFVLFAGAFVAQAGCHAPNDAPQEAPRTAPPGETDEASDEIINGQTDTENRAVCALAVSNGNFIDPFCTATIVGRNGSTGYALSAAHCDTGGSLYLVCTDRYSYCDSGGGTCDIYPVTSKQRHPQYDGGPGRDVMMLQFSGATASTAVVPVVSNDGLSNGNPLEFSGFGVTNGYNETPTDRRMRSFSVVSDLYADAIEAPQSHSGQYGGTCFGDSGGPAFSGTGSNKRVVGVTSQGDEVCNQFGYYARVEYNYSFISNFMGGAVEQDCDTCAQASLDGACSGTLDACVNDAACYDLLVCLNDCQTQSCVNACASNHSGGIDRYNAIIDCMYCDACGSVCQEDFCEDPGSSTSAGATTGGGPSTTSTAAGGTGEGGATGAGGAGAGGDDSAVATTSASGGGKKKTSDEDETTTTTCAVHATGAPASSGLALFGLAMLGGALTARRRRALR